LETSTDMTKLRLALATALDRYAHNPMPIRRFLFGRTQLGNTISAGKLIVRSKPTASLE
jgi:hypothetical protein